VFLFVHSFTIFTNSTKPFRLILALVLEAFSKDLPFFTTGRDVTFCSLHARINNIILHQTARFLNDALVLHLDGLAAFTGRVRHD
jgi:hypothetical protein